MSPNKLDLGSKPYAMKTKFKNISKNDSTYAVTAVKPRTRTLLGFGMCCHCRWCYTYRQ